MSSIVRLKCEECGNTVIRTVRLLYDPLGIPYIRCDKCGEPIPYKKRKEWIQMSPFEKTMAAAPNISEVPVLICLLLAFGIVYLMNILFAWPVSGLRILLVCIVLLYPVGRTFLNLTVNKPSFLHRYTDSILRTGVDEYRNLLARSDVKMHDEELPLGAKFNEGALQWIEAEKERRKNEYTDLASVLSAPSAAEKDP